MKHFRLSIGSEKLLICSKKNHEKWIVNTEYSATAVAIILLLLFADWTEQQNIRNW